MQPLSSFRKIRINQRISCVVCGKKSLTPLIKMPQFPLTEIFMRKKISGQIGFVDQEFHLCDKCGHGQLKNIIDPTVLYGSGYITRTSTSASGKWSADRFLEFLNEVLKNRIVKTILEIGCNDLYTLRKLKNKAEVLYGIDPILKGKEKNYSDEKIKILGDFFENIDIKGLNIRPDIVISSQTLEHIGDPKSLVQKMLDAGSENTIYFFQFPGLETLVNDAHFDQIFHQHLNYFSLESVLHLLNDTGGELINYKVNPYHWGTLMIAFRKRGKTNSNAVFQKKIQKLSPEYILKQYKLFKKGMDHTAERIDSFQDREIYGYGAASMLPVLEYYLNRIRNFKFIIDDDISKKNLFYLNVPVQIKPISQIHNIEESVVVLTAINSLLSVRSLISKMAELNTEKIILPSNLI